MWYRIFCRSAAELAPADLLARLAQGRPAVEGRFRGDDLGWTAAEVVLAGGTPIFVERFLTGEDNLRDDLNTWAAYLETLDYSPNHAALMEHVIQSQQMVTVRKPLDHPNESAVEDVCVGLCQTLAAAGDGIYQVEDRGWYAADGTLLLQEY